MNQRWVRDGREHQRCLILRDIQLMQKKLDEIEEELLKLKIQNLEEEELSEGGELAELERLSRETMENGGVPWEEAKKRLGL